MTSLILNQWKIRAQFQDKRKPHNARSNQFLRSGENLSVHSIKSMEAIICDDKEAITLDFSDVKTLGPSVFTTLTEVCEKLRNDGKETYIHLPDDEDILSAAHRSSFTALFDCTVQNTKPKHFKNNHRFSLVEV